MWARLHALQHFSWHAVRTIDRASVQTYCRGSWAVVEPYETEKRPPTADQCQACNAAMACDYTGVGGCTCRGGQIACVLHVEPIERGLRELCEVTQPIELFMPDDRFDDGGVA